MKDRAAASDRNRCMNPISIARCGRSNSLQSATSPPRAVSQRETWTKHSGWQSRDAAARVSTSRFDGIPDFLRRESGGDRFHLQSCGHCVEPAATRIGEPTSIVLVAHFESSVAAMLSLLDAFVHLHVARGTCRKQGKWRRVTLNQ